MAHRQKFIINSYGLLCALIIGAILGGFYLLQGWLIDVVWPGPTFRPVFNAVWIAVVGAVIYLTQRTTGQFPKALGLIRADLAATGTSSYRYLPLQMLVPALMLTSGTSLGPEATLVSSTCLFGIWLGDKLRYLEHNWAAIHQQGLGRLLRILITPHHYLLRRFPTAKHKSLWTLRMISFFACGILSFYLTCKWGGEPSVIVYLGHFAWRMRDLLWLPPIVLSAWLAGRIYLRLMVGVRHIITNCFTHDWSLLVFGGLAIYLATLFVPSINFSGMHNFHLLATSWQQKPGTFLLVRSFLKLGLLTICLNTGWLGGDIFPVLFASTAQGIALSHLLPHLDPIFVIAVCAISMGATILESPLVAGGVMATMFLPPEMLPICMLTTGCIFLVDRGYQRLNGKYGDQFAILRL
ncbi:chloride channel protein [Lacticaseibacillus jixiensis]|uniref:chloride channel protein n=1 Tax=Lacticaseibacillus jixiensis TaxID=3231926 RepID=UPI0036F20229